MSKNNIVARSEKAFETKEWLALEQKQKEIFVRMRELIGEENQELLDLLYEMDDVFGYSNCEAAFASYQICSDDKAKGVYQ